MDAFRQPKYSYYMFQAQRSPQKSDLIAETGPMVYIAHAMTPFSPKDVTVYSNCDEVRLTVFKECVQKYNHIVVNLDCLHNKKIDDDFLYDCFEQYKKIGRASCRERV